MPEEVAARNTCNGTASRRGYDAKNRRGLEVQRRNMWNGLEMQRQNVWHVACPLSTPGSGGDVGYSALLSYR